MKTGGGGMAVDTVMRTWIESLIESLWQQSWQILLVCVVIGFICLILPRAHAHARYWLWVMALLSLAVPSSQLVRLPNLPEPTQRALTGAVLLERPAAPGPAAVSPTGTVFSEPGTPARGTRRRLDDGRLAALLAGIWGAGVAIHLMGVLWKAVRIQAGLRRRRTDPDLGLECEFVEMLRALEIGARPRLCLITGLSQPFVWGVWRGCIYVPAPFGIQGDSRQRKLVLAHELAHVLRWDALVNALQILLQALFWFHPVVWWLNRRIRREREKCCDETAIAVLNSNPHEYGSAIIHRLTDWHEPAAPASSLAISGGARELEDRVRTILVPGRRFQRRLTIPSVAILAVLGAVLLAGRPVVSIETPAAQPQLALSRESAIDLSPHLNARLGESWLPGQPGNDLAMLRPGQMPLGGLDFDLRGIVQLAGRDLDHALFPTSTGRIRLERTVDAIHLLHATSGRVPDGTVIGQLILEYADQRRETLPVVYGRHVRDWWFWEFEPVSDPRTAMAWTGHNATVREEGASLRLYRTTWINPRPDAYVRHIHYQSTRTDAAPFVVGLTVEEPLNRAATDPMKLSKTIGKL